MRSCTTVVLLLFGLSMVVWMGWEPTQRSADQFLAWWNSRGNTVQEVVEEEPEPPATQALPAPLPPPVVPAVRTMPVRTVMVSDVVDIPYDEPEDIIDLNEVLIEFVDLKYFDTEVIVRSDTDLRRDGVFFEVVDLADSDKREFYMWDTFNLLIYHDIQPNSVVRVHVEWTGEYREQFPAEWTEEMSQQTMQRMTSVLEDDLEHMLLGLNNDLRREFGTLVVW